MSLQQGIESQRVDDVQRALKRQGLNIADRSWFYGPSTAEAVREFQSQHGLAATGVVDQMTWRALGLRGSVPESVRFDR